MLLVRTTLGPSSIHGIGLFAAEPILKGVVLWRYHPSVDRKLTEAELESLAPPCREQMRRYTYREKGSRLYVLCGDDARFFNHAQEPNCVDTDDSPEGLTIAARDISAGEELTCDYSLFDEDLREGRYRIG